MEPSISGVESTSSIYAYIRTVHEVEQYFRNDERIAGDWRGRDIMPAAMTPPCMHGTGRDLIWITAVGVQPSTPAIAAEGPSISAVTITGFLQSIRMETQKWSYATGQPSRSFTCVGADGTIYIGTVTRIFMP